jgi:hypothetical protein
MYHLTLEKNLSSIMDSGLIPAIGSCSAAFGETVAAVYLFKELDDALDALANWYGDTVGDQPVVLLEVDTECLSLIKVEFEYQCLEVISSTAIKVLEYHK